LNIIGYAKSGIWRVLQWRLFRRLLPRLLHTNSFLLKGKTENNASLSLLVFCNYDNIAGYISKFAFSQEPKVEKLQRITYNSMLSVVSRIKPDLVFGEFPGAICNSVSRAFLVLPRVNFSLDISPPMEQIVGNMKQLRRRSIRKIEASSYVYEVTKDPAKFKLFYEDIYLPLVAKTEKDSFSRLIPFGVAEKWFLRGELLLIKLDDAYLAGLLYHPETNNTVHCRMIAYNEGLAGQAALYHLIQTAKRDGYTSINYGAASPFMSDGLFFYKKSLGMVIEFKDSTSIFGLKISNFEEPVREFLVNNPCVLTDSERMIALVILPRPVDEVNVSSICHDNYVRGLSRLFIAYPCEVNKHIGGLLPEASPQKLMGGLDSFISLIRSANYEIGFFDFEASLHNQDVTAKAQHESETRNLQG